MTQEEFNEQYDYIIGKSRDMLCRKAEEYATDNDRMHNFNVAAAVMGCLPIEALAGMMSKHTVSVYDLVHRRVQAEQSVPRETWEEKIIDHINYLVLLWAMVGGGDYD